MENRPGEKRWQSPVIGVVLVLGLVTANRPLVAPVAKAMLPDAEDERT